MGPSTPTATGQPGGFLHQVAGFNAFGLNEVICYGAHKIQPAVCVVYKKSNSLRGFLPDAISQLLQQIHIQIAEMLYHQPHGTNGLCLLQVFVHFFQNLPGLKPLQLFLQLFTLFKQLLDFMGQFLWRGV